MVYDALADTKNQERCWGCEEKKSKIIDEILCYLGLLLISLSVYDKMFGEVYFDVFSEGGFLSIFAFIIGIMFFVICGMATDKFKLDNVKAQ